MTQTLTRHDLESLARIVEPPRIPAEVDRTFGLPTGLFVATVGLYFAFLGVMAAGFATRGLIVPMAIIFVYIAMAFGVPMMWARMNPPSRSRALTWAEFRRRGIDTATGRLGATEASVQVLILPVLILFWGVATAMIAALV